MQEKTKNRRVPVTYVQCALPDGSCQAMVPSVQTIAITIEAPIA